MPSLPAAQQSGVCASPLRGEAQRRTRYLARVRTTMDQPVALTDERFDQALDSLGVTSVSELMVRAALLCVTRAVISPFASGLLSSEMKP